MGEGEERTTDGHKKELLKTNLSGGVFVTENIVRHTGEEKISSLPVGLGQCSPRTLIGLTGCDSKVIQHVG